MLSNQIILSVLIPTIPGRVAMFSRLHTELFRQVTYMHTVHPTLGRIQVEVDDSAKFLDGGLSIGKKRESLVRKAKGKYLCFLDDDDSIAPNYLETLVRLCHEDRDVCTFMNISKFDNYWTVVDMSLWYENEDAGPGRVVRRSAWHICPVLSDYAKRVQFEDSNYGEDWSWFNQVIKFCKLEAKSYNIIHQYHHGVHSEADRITKAI